MFSKLYDIFESIAHTLYPNLCIGCETEPKANQNYFCVECLSKMPYTDHFRIKQNIVTNHLKGRVPIHHGAALMYFRQSGIVQNMIHRIKYKGDALLAYTLGEIAGDNIKNSEYFSKPDIIIPVPLHPAKLKKRGFNQAFKFGEGIGHSLQIPCKEGLIIKSTSTPSQTGFSRIDRVSNVENTFTLSHDLNNMSFNHILIVDDVITTGATIESCIFQLSSQKNTLFSVATIAAATS